MDSINNNYMISDGAQKEKLTYTTYLFAAIIGKYFRHRYQNSSNQYNAFSLANVDVNLFYCKHGTHKQKTILEICISINYQEVSDSDLI